MMKISPLSNPRATSSNISRISDQSSLTAKENQRSFVRRVPTSYQRNREKRDAKEEINKTEKDHQTQADSARRSIPERAARVPLKQVFENDMEKAQRFVKNIVGYGKKKDTENNEVFPSVDDLT